MQPVAVDDRLEGSVLPQLARRDRLDVVVAVDDDRRRVRVVAGPAREDGRQPRRSPRPRPSGSRRRAGRAARCSADRRTSAWCAGSPEIDGMRSQAVSRSRNASAPSATAAARDPARGGRRRRRVLLVPVVLMARHPMTPGRAGRSDARRRLASGRCAWRPSTSSVAGPSRHGRGRRGRPARRRRDARTPTSSVLQEVDRAQPRSHRVDQTAVVAAALGAAYVALPADPARHTRRRRGRAAAGDGSGEQPPGPAYGIGLVSRHSGDGVGRYVASSPRRSACRCWSRPGADARRRRAAGRAGRPVIETPSGPMTVVGTHLSFVPGWNVAQLRELVRWARHPAGAAGPAGRPQPARPVVAAEHPVDPGGPRGDVPLVEPARAVRPRAARARHRADRDRDAPAAGCRSATTVRSPSTSAHWTTRPRRLTGAHGRRPWRHGRRAGSSTASGCCPGVGRAGRRRPGRRRAGAG